MSRTIYIVTGNSGSYDDYQEWNVRAHATEEAAEAHRKRCEDANTRKKALQKLAMAKDPDWATYDTGGYVPDKHRCKAETHPYLFVADPLQPYEHTEYTIEALELEE